MCCDSPKQKTTLDPEGHSGTPAKREYDKPTFSRKSYREPVLSRLPINDTESGIEFGAEILILLS